jgi:dihydrofolate reductase
MKVSLIVAVAENGVIGKDNDLIWHLPKDMRFFKETTTGHHVIMGRKNFESIPERFRPLPNRTNVVITRQSDYQAEGCEVVNSLEAALELAQANGDAEPFIIGGGQIYKLALEGDVVDKIYLTKVHQGFEGDTFFSELSEEWKEVDRVEHQKDEKHCCDFSIITYEK